ALPSVNRETACRVYRARRSSVASLAWGAMGWCLAVGGFNQPSVAVRVASNTRRPAATPGVTRRRTVAASAGIEPEGVADDGHGQRDLVVELAAEPAPGERPLRPPADPMIRQLSPSCGPRRCLAVRWRPDPAGRNRHPPRGCPWPGCRTP